MKKWTFLLLFFCISCCHPEDDDVPLNPVSTQGSHFFPSEEVEEWLGIGISE